MLDNPRGGPFPQTIISNDPTYRRDILAVASVIGLDGAANSHLLKMNFSDYEGSDS